MAADDDWFEMERRREEADDKIPCQPAKDNTVHHVGDPFEGVQLCVICGGWVIDNRNVVGQHGSRPKFFEPGPVTKMRGGAAAGDLGLPHCQPGGWEP